MGRTEPRTIPTYALKSGSIIDIIVSWPTQFGRCNVGIYGLNVSKADQLCPINRGADLAWRLPEMASLFPQLWRSWKLRSGIGSISRRRASGVPVGVSVAGG